MSLYDSVLTKAEQKALEKRTHSLQDDINLLRTLIGRELSADGQQDTRRVAGLMGGIARLEALRSRTEPKAGDELQLALISALDILETETEL